MYEAAAVQFYKATACLVAPEWSYLQGYCLVNQYIEELPADAFTKPASETADNTSPFKEAAVEEESVPFDEDAVPFNEDGGNNIMRMVAETLSGLI